MLYEGTKKALSCAGEFMKGIPFVGGVIGIIDKAIDAVSNEYNQFKFTNKVNSINNIFVLKNDNITFEDDLSLLIAKLALEIT